MRRLITLIIMFIVPLQFASAAMHGYVGKNVAALDFHAHDYDHLESGHLGNDFSGDKNGKNHNEDGHHDHYHPVFSILILVESGLTLNIALSGGPILHRPATFFSRSYLPLDRPPLARA